MKSKKYANGLFRGFTNRFLDRGFSLFKGFGRILEHRSEDTFAKLIMNGLGYGFLCFYNVRSGKCCFKSTGPVRKAKIPLFHDNKDCGHNFLDLVKYIY